MTTKAELLRVVRDKCLDCCCFQLREVRSCTVYTCSLHPFRMGKDPNPSKGRGFARSPGYTGCNEHEEAK